MTLAAQYADREITTIEGLALDGRLSALQAAFISYDGFQCGYCTSGQICAATAMLREFAAGRPSAVSPDIAAKSFAFTDAEIKERMSGNICRCGAYVGIVEAIREAQQQQPTSAQPAA
ncbi:MAG: 2Fe-2S iron-sulfur cluster-binding protein [Hymenobacter sp.]